MRVTHFAKLLAGNNAVKINKDLIIFNDFELYSLETDESRQYKSLDELLDNEPEVKKIILDAEYFALRFDGGRGSSSENGKMGGGFTSAGGRGGFEQIANATLNFNTAGGNSIKAVLGRFRDKYGNAPKEYGAAVDELGYVHKLGRGGKTSVSISGNEGQTIIHNHPGGGNFSSADLTSVASTKAKGIIATDSMTKNPVTYHFQKNQNFKPKEFIKAMRNAKWPTKYSYNQGADWWLKKNQRAFGYKYSSKHLIGE